MNSIEKMVCSFGGADIDMLYRCPRSDKKKFFFSGIAIINTAILSAASMGITLNAINKALSMAVIVPCALIWGWFIFIIDSGLLATIHKQETSNFKSVLAILLRIGISVLISCSVSQPIEVIIFKKFIPMAQRKQQLMYREKLDNSKRNEERQAKEAAKEAAEKLTEWMDKSKELYSNDSILLALTQDKELLVSHYNSLNQQYTALNKGSVESVTAAQRTADTIQKQINQINQRHIESEVTDQDQQQIRLLTNQKSTYTAIIASENAKINRRKHELLVLRHDIQNKQTELAERRKEIDAANNRITHMLQAEKDRADTERHAISSEAVDQYKETEKASEIFLDDNLITGLVAIHVITTWKDDPEATLEEKGIAERVLYMKILVMLIFLVVDVAPVLIKLFFKRGIYEEEKDAEEAAIRQICVARAFRIKEAENKFFETKRQADLRFAEIENLDTIYKRFWRILNRMRENTMTGLYRKDIAKFQDKQQREFPDNTHLIKDIFQHTQTIMMAMFKTLEDRYSTSFVRRASNQTGDH